jgi:hypothetical protein
MPYLSKKVISQYFRTECTRQLRLDLSPDNACAGYFRYRRRTRRSQENVHDFLG